MIGVALQFVIVVTMTQTSIPDVGGLEFDGWREATTNIRASVDDLCRRETEHHAKTGSWLPVAPVPARIPSAPTVATAPAFETLGFSPKELAVQYAVIAAGQSVQCIARAYLDESGVPWTVAADTDESGDIPPRPRSD